MRIILCSFAMLIISLVLTLLSEAVLIPSLSKRAKQPIYADGPSWHLSKIGTPTMGGLGFIPSFILPLSLLGVMLYYSGEETLALSILLSAIYSIANSLIGVFDDIMKLIRRQNAGLTPKQKIFLQLLLAVIFLMARDHLLSPDRSISVLGYSFNIGIVYYPFMLLLLLGTVNCANLTDGVDGLASSVSLTIGVVSLIISISRGMDAVGLLSSALIGCMIGFLVFNRHPAKIFMGDTGSLMLGAFAAAIVLCMDNPLFIIFLGGVYVIEGLSVIIQVIWFKLTGKRFFKMAPLHHHLERCGLSESHICIMGVITTVLLSAIGLLILRI